MWSIKSWFKKIKEYFSGGKIEDGGEQPTIRIGERRYPQSPSSASGSTPKIKVRAIHRNDSTTNENVYQDEVDVVNRNLGRGIVVNKRRKPGRCPICATRGKVVANTSGGDSWRCIECDSTFN